MEGIDEVDEDVDVDVDSYVSNLRRQTEDTVDLVQKLHSTTGKLKQVHRRISAELEEEHVRREAAETLAKTLEQVTEELQQKTRELEKEVQHLEGEVQQKEELVHRAVQDQDIHLAKLTNDICTQEALMKGLKYMWQNIDAFRVGEGVLQEPCGACMLPDGCVVVADTMQGILLFSAQTELIRQLTSPEWKWPQGLVYDTINSLILVSLAKKHPKGNWRRNIGYFNLQLEPVKWLEGPSDGYIDETVAKERLCLAPGGGELYLTLCDKIGSALYKYSSDQWIQVTKRSGASFVDCQVLAVLGPITELLIVEQRMGYIHRLSVHGSDIVDRKSLAIIEKPGAICVDEKRQLFVHDILSGKVRQIDTILFEPMRDICTTDESVFSITASHGYLGVAVRETKVVRVYRYVSAAK
uniref:Uncharacterized protein n=1 Tax=Plectus sambesii TaxID=2011161 RepID=A0A914UWQ9_9BILA